MQYCFHSRETNAGKAVEIRRVLVGFRPVCIPNTIRSTNKTSFLLVLRYLFVPPVEMKGSCALAASVLAASVVALSSSSSDREECLHSSSCSTPSPLAGKGQSGNSVAKEFVPRFDGLRFIETLVTAHR